MPFKKTPPAYMVWRSMKDRCLNKNNAAWPHYGGRGITVCERWLNYSDWAADMLPRLPGFSIERIDNEAGYSPCNCYWADKKTQQRNRRVATFVVIEGVRYRAIELAEQAGVKTDTIIERAAKGMTLAEVTFSGRHTSYATPMAAIAARKANAVERRKTRTHCRHGHPTETYGAFTPKGHFTCRACGAAKTRRQLSAKRLAKQASDEG